MQAQYTKADGCKEFVACDFSAEEVDKAFNKTVALFARNFKMAGFRTGKVPVNVVEQHLGDDLYYKVMEELSTGVMKEVDEKYGMMLTTPLSPKEGLEIEFPKRGESYSLEYEYNYVPILELPEYKSLPVKIKHEDITEQELEDALHEFFRQTLELIPSDSKKVGIGEVAKISIEISGDGEKFSGFPQEVEYALPCKTLLKPLEETVRSLAIGETKEVAITFPSESDEAKANLLSGKACTFRITLNGILKPVATEWNDQLVQDIGYETFDAFKEAFKGILKQNKENNENSLAQGALLDQITSKMECDIPTQLVSMFSEALLENFEGLANAQGFSLSLLGSLLSDIMQSARTSAEKMAKGQVALLNIAKKENIDVTERELGYFIQYMAKQSGVSPEELYKEYQEENMIFSIYQRILADKATKFIFDNASIEREGTLPVDKK